MQSENYCKSTFLGLVDFHFAEKFSFNKTRWNISALFWINILWKMISRYFVRDSHTMGDYCEPCFYNIFSVYLWRRNECCESQSKQAMQRIQVSVGYDDKILLGKHFSLGAWKFMSLTFSFECLSLLRFACVRFLWFIY